MTLLDKAVLELPVNFNDGRGEVIGTFEIATGVEIEEQLRTSFLLNQTADRILGAVGAGGGGGDPDRAGVTIDVGGGTVTQRVSFTEANGGTNPWGDESGNSATDATGADARKKKEVLSRYFKTGRFGSAKPARLKIGEYHEDGEYENYIPVAIQQTRMTVDAEIDGSIDGQLQLVEIRDSILGGTADGRGEI